MYNTEGASSSAPIGIVERVTLRLDYVRGAVASALWSLRLYAPARSSLLGLKKKLSLSTVVYARSWDVYESCSLRAWSSSTGVLILVSDYVRMVRLDGLLPCSEAGDAGEEAEVDEPIIDCGAQHATRAPGALPVRPVGLRWQLQGAPGEHQRRGRGQSHFRGYEGVRWALL